MLETRGIESHKRVELAKKSDKKYTDICPKYKMISRTG